MEYDVRELTGSECKTLRLLWEKVFYEDSKEFTEYYFKEKVSNNRAFVIQINQVNIAMLHLTPYEMKLRTGGEFIRIKSNYIVGVATEKEYRGRGYMRKLIRVALGAMYRERMPFAFLMPADPKIYERYQFTYIYDRTEFKVKSAYFKKRELRAAAASEYGAEEITEEGIPGIVNYVNKLLHKKYDVFVQRDASYYRLMRKELKAQNGGIYLLWENIDGKRETAGYCLYSEEDGKTFVQEALGEKENKVLKENGTKPIIMARVINVQAMLELLRLKPGNNITGGQIEVTIKIEDSWIEENEGIWKCTISEKDAVIVKSEADMEERCSTTADRLTAWIFGYKSIEECFDFAEGQDELCKLKEIQNFSRVFINEIV